MAGEIPLLSELPLLSSARTPRFDVSRLRRSVVLLLVSVELTYAAAFLLPGPSDLSSNALVIVELAVGAFTIGIVLGVSCLPGAAAVYGLVGLMERRRAAPPLRIVGALAVSPLLGVPPFILGGFEGVASDWLFLFGPGVVFAIGSVWIGLRSDRPDSRSTA